MKTTKIPLLILCWAISMSSSYGRGLSDAHFGLKEGYLQSMFAKELCSCIYVSDLRVFSKSGLSEPQRRQLQAKQCLERMGLPIPKSIIKAILKGLSFQSESSRSSREGYYMRTKFLGDLISLKVLGPKKTATAIYLGPKKGCRLVENQGTKAAFPD